MKLSILIPVYNAEKTIAQLCDALVELYALRYDLEIVLVNDGSTDGTDATCRRLHAGHPSVVTYVKLSRNFGEHNALMAGLHHVTGDYCVMMDDDFQNPPEEIAKLVDELRKGYDVVYGRFAAKKHHWLRNLGSRFNDRMATVMLKKPAGLYLSSFKALNRFMVTELVKYTRPDPYLDAIILRTTNNIGTVLVEHERRARSGSGYTLGKLVSLWGNMVVSFSLVPIRIIGIVGFAMFVFGIGYALWKAGDGVGPPGGLTHYETLISDAVFSRGLLLLALSLLGEYVGRIYLLLNKDPQFIVRSALRAENKAAVGENLAEEISHAKPR